MNSALVSDLGDDLAQLHHVERRGAFHRFTTRNFVAVGESAMFRTTD
jgi:hypothetical protein